MAGFVVGDSLGSLKTIQFSRSEDGTQINAESTPLGGVSQSASKGAIQKMQLIPGLYSITKSRQLVTLHANGTAALYEFVGNGAVHNTYSWKESRFKPQTSYIGLGLSNKGIYTCTSHGGLRLTTLKTSADDPISHQTAALPMRLLDWQLALGNEKFAYGGDEVEVSVWDTTRAFSTEQASTTTGSTKTKRKRGGDLLPAEIWRARNVANDEISLRNEVRNTSLAFLDTPEHLLAGTGPGHVRRYDTRTARKPVADWRGIVKTGGVRHVEKGCREYEAFISDNHSNLSAIDLRNGRILYSYKGMSAAITAHTQPLPTTANLLASACNDRYIRLHSTESPPTIAGTRQDAKGTVLASTYVSVAPTAIIWDGLDVRWHDKKNEGNIPVLEGEGEGEDEDEDGDDIWVGMEDAEESEDDGKPTRPSKKKKH